MYWSEQKDSVKQGERGTKEFWMPERRLLAAVLHRAVADYTGSDSSLAAEAAEWIFEEITQPYALCSFAWTCEQLELDPALIAGAIACLPRQTEALPREGREGWEHGQQLAVLARGKAQ